MTAAVQLDIVDAAREANRPRLLDLYCKAGGASMGYHLAGFDVVGVDIEPQPHYPFEFVRADALEVLADRGYLAGFDAIGASPPCKSENPLRHLHDTDHPDLLTPTLDLLADVTVPWVVENVAATRKMPGALVLCGSEFGLKATCADGVVRWLRRHRRFASNVLLMGAGGCHCAGRPIAGVYGTGGGGPQQHSHKFRPAEGRVAMGIAWMTQAELSQAIPPAFTRHIGEQVYAALPALDTARSAR